MPKGERRLAAIMFTDMVGYTAIGQKNESLSLAMVQEQRKLIRPLLERHKGREVKTMGDAFLVEFHSALDAVRCAYDIQRAARELSFSLPEDRRVALRIGVHVGDVIESQNDVQGDAVNIASRIEPLAEDGGVCLTRQVYDNVQNKFDLPLISLGSKSLKNVNSPMEVYRILMPWEKRKTSPTAVLNPRRIAVMPFANMSPDPGDEYFADGMTEELISTMSKIEQFEIISRTSVMLFKKNPKPIREVSRELDAGTVLEGSVRKAGNKLRVTVQMIDAAKDRHTWSESYDRELKDVFSIQSEISKAVAEELKVRIVPRERARLEKEPTANTEAYKLFLKGRYHWNMRTKDEMQKAVQFFTDAIRIDPSYARAYYGLADCYIILENWGFMKPEEAFAKYRIYAAKALELDPMLAEAHVMLAAIKTSKEWDIEGAERELKRAIELDPNSSLAHQRYGLSLLGPQGRHKEALSELRDAARLDPLSPMIASNVGDELLLEDRYEEAEKQYRRILETRPDFPYAHSRLGLSLLKESRYDEGTAEIEKARNLSKDPWGIVSDLILAYAVAGRRDDSERLLADLEQRSKQEYISNVILAMANAAAGKDDRAIELLRKAEAEKSNQLLINLGEPHFDKLRPDSRFQTLMKTVGIKKTG